MLVVNPEVSIYRESDALKKIETICRVCTNTQDKVGSNPDFIQGLLDKHHGTPFEHYRIDIPESVFSHLIYTSNLEKTGFIPYGLFGRTKVDNKTASINVRDFLALGGTIDAVEEYPESKDYMTVRFLIDRGLSAEFNRHRQNSMMERSTRYYNLKDLEVVKPYPFEWADNSEDKRYCIWKFSCGQSENQYRQLLAEGCTPQEARTVLPMSTATILYHTATYNQWKDMLRLRLGKGAHPSAKYVMQKLLDLPDCPEEVKNF